MKRTGGGGGSFVTGHGSWIEDWSEAMNDLLKSDISSLTVIHKSSCRLENTVKLVFAVDGRFWAKFTYRRFALCLPNEMVYVVECVRNLQRCMLMKDHKNGQTWRARKSRVMRSQQTSKFQNQVLPVAGMWSTSWYHCKDQYIVCLHCILLTLEIR